MDKKNYAVKLFIVCLFSFFSVLAINAQGTADQSSGNQAASIDDLPLKPMRLPALPEVNGSVFLTADYIPASVLIKDKTVTDVPVKFNIYSNAIMVLKDGSELRLESFQMVSYDETANDGSVKHYKFKTGYPEIDNHTDKSIYQVLSFGPNVHLLKFLSQKVEDASTLGDYSRREIVTTEQLYVYTPGGEIKHIKASKQSVLDALPAMAVKINEIANAKQLKLKNEAEISSLIDELNKP